MRVCRFMVGSHKDDDTVTWGEICVRNPQPTIGLETTH